MKKLMFILLILLLSGIVYADEEKIIEGEKLVQSKTSCSLLTEDQLESIGEYYMELMHPGEIHEIMDQRMGGEGSESLKQAHINIAQMMYCGNRNAISQNMMNRGGFQGMMGSYGPGFGMMSYWPFGEWNILFWIIVILILAYFFIKYFKDGNLNLGSDSLEILKKRYAKGEITKKEFEQMKKDLRE